MGDFSFHDSQPVERMSLTDVAKRLGVHVATTWRWALRGVKGKKLQTVMVGGRRYVTRDSLAAFLSSPSPIAQHPEQGFLRRAENAGRILDGIGVAANSVKAKKSSQEARPSSASKGDITK